MKYPPVKHKNVLVTGCSSGIGRATAELLRSEGWNVVPTARKPQDIKALREAGFEPVELDVASDESVKKAADEVLVRFNGGLGGIVNNAGLGIPGAIEDLSRETMRYQFEVNLFGLQDLTNRFIPVFREQGYGRIVNVSSVGGRICLPFMGIYSASKFALEAVSDALRAELSLDGISVSLIEPGPIETRFSVNAADRGEKKLDMKTSRFGPAYRQYFEKRKRESWYRKDIFRKPPDVVAKKILHALDSPRPHARYCITVPAYAGAFVRRFFPTRLTDQLILGLVKKRFQ